MVDGFPIPRHELPKVVVTREEHAICRDFMDRMLRRVVATYETFEQCGVDTRLWKHMASRDELNLYAMRKRPLGPSVDQYGPLSHFKTALPPVDLLLTGESPGTMEKIMHGVITPSQLDLALVVTYLHVDVLDCALLNNMEEPTEEEPFHYLGYKLFVRKSPVNSSLLKHRDSTYLEACGLMSLSNGEQIGYHIMQSVDLEAFPPLVDRHCIRAKQSVAYLYRQKGPDAVEVFMLGSVDLGGLVIRPVAKRLIADLIFGIARRIEISEAKSLTEMLRRREGYVALTKDELGACMRCEKRMKKLVASSSVIECPTCGNPTCSQCRVAKRVFVGDGIMGRFDKIECCKTCVFAAKRGVSDIESSTSSSSRTLSPVQPERRYRSAQSWPNEKVHTTIDDSSRVRAHTALLT